MLSIAGSTCPAIRRQQENHARIAPEGACLSVRRRPSTVQTRRARQTGAGTVAGTAGSAIRSPLDGRIDRHLGNVG